MSWASVKAAYESIKPKPPENSFTCAEYAAEFKLCASGARFQLRRLVAAGKLKKTIIIEGCARVPYYTTVQSETCPTAQKSSKTKKR